MKGSADMSAFFFFSRKLDVDACKFLEGGKNMALDFFFFNFKSVFFEMPIFFVECIKDQLFEQSKKNFIGNKPKIISHLLI